MSFVNKVVLVTGAGSGIGEAVAIKLAKEGAKVAILDKNEGSLNETAARCYTISGKSLAIKADISVDDEAKAAVEKTISVFGQLDILINNAGIFRDGKIIADNFVETYDVIMRTNLRALAHITSLAAPHLAKCKGNIVNLSSVSSLTTLGVGCVAYSVSKAGVNHFTRLAALELSQYGVRVNAVSPGIVKTNIFLNTAFNWDDVPEAPLKRESEPEEIADLIMFLASDKAKAITGSNYVIDNGYCIKN